jgi:hypothetical protein
MKIPQTAGYFQGRHGEGPEGSFRHRGTQKDTRRDTDREDTAAPRRNGGSVPQPDAKDEGRRGRTTAEPSTLNQAAAEQHTERNPVGTAGSIPPGQVLPARSEQLWKASASFLDPQQGRRDGTYQKPPEETPALPDGRKTGREGGGDRANPGSRGASNRLSLAEPRTEGAALTAWDTGAGARLARQLQARREGIHAPGRG